MAWQSGSVAADIGNFFSSYVGSKQALESAAAERADRERRTDLFAAQNELNQRREDRFDRQLEHQIESEQFDREQELWERDQWERDF